MDTTEPAVQEDPATPAVEAAREPEPTPPAPRRRNRRRPTKAELAKAVSKLRA